MVKRENVKITVEAVNMKKNPLKGVKKDGAWRYPGGVIQRLAQREIDGITYFDPKDPTENRRKIESNFFITLNTNRTLSNVEGGLAEMAKTACKEALTVLAKDEVICQYLKFGPKDKEFQNDRYKDVISKIEWQAAVETGERWERLHAHIWMTVHHYSQVQINMPIMQHLFKQYYNDRAPATMKANGKPYISVKLLPTSDWAEVIKGYMHKAMSDPGTSNPPGYAPNAQAC